MKRWLSIVTALCLFALPGVAQAHTATAQLGSLSATFSYTGSAPEVHDGTLTISQNGTVLYSQPVSSKWCATDCDPALLDPHTSILHVVPLAPTGEVDVVLDLYTGGAHCCSVEQVFSPGASGGTYVESEYDFGDPGAKLEDLNHNGEYEFVTADDSFAYEFTDFAGSGLPLEIMDFSGGRFDNVTRSYPSLIAKDARSFLRGYRSAAPQYTDTTGVIAAWAADEDELGHQAKVARYLGQQAREGHLRTPLYPHLRGRRFIRVLDRFLRRHGYLRS